MKTKKLLSTLLAGAMALSLAVPAFAADETVLTGNGTDGISASTEITGTTQTPILKLTVPDSGSVIVNPYKLTVTPTDGDATTDQIISATQYIKSESNVPIAVSVTVTGKLPESGGEVVLATSALKGTETTKSAFVYFECVQAEYDLSGGNWNAVTWANGFDKAKHAVLSTKGASLSKVVTIPAAESADWTASTPTLTKCYGAAFHLTGSVASTSTKAWTSSDTIGATIAFTFLPQAAAASTSTGSGS